MADTPTPPGEPPRRPAGCEKCPHPCSVHYTRVSAEGAQTLGMCANCPQAKALAAPAPTADFEDAALPEPVPAADAAPRCPSCGFALADFEREKSLGCPRCYEVFSDTLHEVLRSAQAGQTHHGKHPANRDGMLREARLREARTELALAVAKEDFESAARLRDEIRTLEKTGPGPAPPSATPAVDAGPEI